MRLFISVSLSDEVKSCVSAHTRVLKQHAVRGRYPSVENYHITLAFIGETNDAEKVKRALSDCHFSPFEISVGDFGSFGQLYYVGVSSSDGCLGELAQTVRDALKNGDVPFDRKKFTPHITIGRDVQLMSGEKPSSMSRASMTVNEFSLMRSDVIAGKRVYRKIFTVKSDE